MPATTSTQTKPAAQTVEGIESATAKAQGLEMIEANTQAKTTHNQHSAAMANSAVVVNNIEKTEAVTAHNETAPAENSQASTQTMAQPAQQWRNCRKPHRI